MYGLDLINTSVLGALGCDMSVFLRYFPAAETMYEIFVALAIGLILLIWIWNLVKNFGLGLGTEAEDPVKLSIRAVVFILLLICFDFQENALRHACGQRVQFQCIDFGAFEGSVCHIT